MHSGVCVDVGGVRWGVLCCCFDEGLIGVIKRVKRVKREVIVGEKFV